MFLTVTTTPTCKLTEACFRLIKNCFQQMGRMISSLLSTHSVLIKQLSLKALWSP
ncbi:hypothetical protein OIU84_023411 [Salix udensis]|uniref:Uncharacterized protein n=1 Tax=Salix udensis TaxID=889485 RepID=A0AAD6PGX1_9ROSI|nr:hypothetical protein OIU84_023411 [Salix udensis]